jgi:predicted alpha/beta superfamily hydrolase
VKCSLSFGLRGGAAAVLAMLLATGPGPARETPDTGVLASATPLVIGHSLVMHSEVLDEDRMILVYLPADYETNEQPLPVIYLLDGRGNFHHTTASVDLLGFRGKMPRSMVVGIANVDRGRDFTAVHTEGRSSGGADRFLDFIESELIPFIDAGFRTAPHRTIIGHSLGGLLVFHALVERPDLFDAAIAVSPALTNDERVGGGSSPLSARLDAALKDREDWRMSLFITMSDGEEEDWEVDLERVLAVLKKTAPAGFEWRFRRMPGEDHGTTVLESTYDGLRFIHAEWDATDLLEHGTVAELEARFERLSETLGFQVRPPEPLVNLMGYRLLGSGRGDEAIEAFDLAVSLYPESANVYDSLGEALERLGKLPGAMLNYRRAVSRAETDGDRRLPIFRANLERVERLLLRSPARRDPSARPTVPGPPEGGLR